MAFEGPRNGVHLVKISAFAIALVAGSLLSSVALAQQNLYLKKTLNIGATSSITQDQLTGACTIGTSFFVGNIPTAVGLVGNKVFVGGLVTNSCTNFPAGFPVNIVQIDDWTAPALAYRNFPVTLANEPAPSFTTTLNNNANGFTGMSFAPGFGLLVAYDNGAQDSPGAIRRYDVTTQLTPILLNAASYNTVTNPINTTAWRHGSGPAWDFGPAGLGYDQNGDTVIDGPAASFLSFTGGSASVRYPGFSNRQAGPIGLKFNDLSRASGFLYDCDTGQPGPVQTPHFIGNDADSQALDGTFYRDLDADPRPTGQGLMVARANNDLVMITRDANNARSFFNVVKAATPAPFVNHQNASILWGMPGGDLVVYNDRPVSTSGQAFSNVVKFLTTTGAPASVNLLDASGAALPVGTFIDGIGLYDFFWDGANQRLAVLDGSARAVYIFETAPDVPACPADLDNDGVFPGGTPDGGVDINDLLYFLSAFEAGSVEVDLDNDGDPAVGTPDGGTDINDLLFFLARFEGGC